MGESSQADNLLSDTIYASIRVIRGEGTADSERGFMSESQHMRRPGSEKPQPGPLDLSLWQVLGLIGFVAFCCFAILDAGLTAFLFLVALLLIFLAPMATSYRTRGAVLTLLVIVVLLALLSLSGPGSRGSTSAMVCTNNLKQIGLALHNYYDFNGCFPPPYVADEHGVPLCSWRVLLLPYLDEQRLYEQWHFGEPWNSPHNAKLAKNPLDVFQCPKSADERGETSQPVTDYLAVVGPGMAWEEGACMRLGDFGDGTCNTMMVVEVVGSTVNWAEPADFNREEMSLEINGEAGRSIGSYHRGPRGVGATNVLLVDASARMWTDDELAKYIKPMLTRDGGEEIDHAWFE